MLLIHVVAAGETLNGIAARYGVSVESIATANRPPNPNKLVIGQALIIPTEQLVYTVRSGDTLYRISQIFGLTIGAIAAANNLANPNLLFPGQELAVPEWESLIHIVQPGQTLSKIAGLYGVSLSLLLSVNQIANPNLIYPGQRIVIPRRGVAKRPLTTNGFIFSTGLNTARNTLKPIGRLLTYISIFDFPADGNGGIGIPNYALTVQAAREENIASLAVLTNFSNGNFSPELARSILANPDIKARTIASYVGAIQQGRMAGAMVDFENMFPEDRQLYTDFIAALSARLRSLGLVISIAVAPKWADFPNAPWIGAFDYAALGRLVDYMYIMTYEWGWVGGPPQPIAPVNLVRRVLAYATSLIPADRIMQGINLYGYDWPLPDTPETIATTVDPQQAIVLAAAYGATILYDEVAASPYFNYVDAGGRSHQVWFEDARSSRAKYMAAHDYNLMGTGYWQLGNDFPQNWVILSELFSVVKR